MWVESQVHVGNDSIGLRIERLDADACERTAAVLAWLTLEAMRSGAEAECDRGTNSSMGCSVSTSPLWYLTNVSQRLIRSGGVRW